MIPILPTLRKVNALHGVVNCYKERASLDRTSQTLVEGFKTIYPVLGAGSKSASSVKGYATTQSHLPVR